MLDLTFVTINVGGTSNFSSVEGINAYAGKSALFERQVAGLGVHMAGFQEAHSKAGGVAKFGDYVRVVPDPLFPVKGDLELWLNCKLPWDPQDSQTVLQPKDVVITHQGEQFFVANVNTSWIQFDVVVSHAPHTWAKVDDIDVEKAIQEYWVAIETVLS